MTRRCAAASVGALLCILAWAGAAQAQTWTLYAGGYQGPGYQALLAKTVGAQTLSTIITNDNPEIDKFSLKQLQIHVGDKVQWLDPSGAHTVTFAKGKADIPLFETSPTGAKYSGFLDASGNPFWFNGQTQIQLDPAGALAAGVKMVAGKQVGTENGSQLVGSGMYNGNASPPPFVLTFNKAGTYDYQCTVHPNMNGSIKVLPRGTKVPSPAADLSREKASLIADAKTIVKLVSYTPPADTVSGGHDQGQLATLRFYPTSLHVAVGTTVTFSQTSDVQIHTFTFGPTAYLSSISNSAGLELPPAFPFSSEAPSSTPTTYDGTNHGNGFLNTGVLDANPGATQASSFKVTFTKAGTYDFQCLIHPFMKGEVVVS